MMRLSLKQYSYYCLFRSYVECVLMNRLVIVCGGGFNCIIEGHKLQMQPNTLNVELLVKFLFHGGVNLFFCRV